jgi:nucleotide-binding universal stress UspA family protein
MPARIDLRLMNPSIPRRQAAMDPAGALSVHDVAGVGRPFRDILVARTYEPRADAAASLVAHALAARVADVPVIRAEDEALERQARHAALAVVGTPSRRRPAGMPGGDPSTLAERLRIPVIVVPARSVGAELTGARSIVCGVRDRADIHCAAAAGALADALDLQLVLVHVCDQARPATVGSLFMPATALAETTPEDRATARELLGTVAHLAGRTAPGAACPRVLEGPAGDGLDRAGRGERAAIVAVSASRRGPVASAVFGSTARHVARRADRPVLICPRRPDRALRLDSQIALVS